MNVLGGVSRSSSFTKKGKSTMIDKPQIKQTTAQHTACIHLEVSLEEMMQSFGPAIEEIVAALTRQGMPPASGAFAHHFKITCRDGAPVGFDFEVGFVTEKPVAPAGRVYASRWPAQKVAHTTYRGPYEGLPGAWGEFTDWMDAGGLEQAEDLWEHYVAGPQTSPDSSKWRTELYRPLL
jgi:effector-binding domain-containing protein